MFNVVMSIQTQCDPTPRLHAVDLHIESEQEAEAIAFVKAYSHADSVMVKVTHNEDDGYEFITSNGSLVTYFVEGF